MQIMLDIICVSAKMFCALLLNWCLCFSHCRCVLLPLRMDDGQILLVGLDASVDVRERIESIGLLNENLSQMLE